MDSNDWEREMRHLMEMFEHESTISLRKINRCFVSSGRPFDEKFREYFLNQSNLRLNFSFNTILFERGFENPLQVIPNNSTSINGNEIANNANVPMSANVRVDSLNALPTENSVEPKIEKAIDAPIEIVDSDEDRQPMQSTNQSIGNQNTSMKLNHRIENPNEIHDIIDLDDDLPLVAFDPNPVVSIQKQMPMTPTPSAPAHEKRITSDTINSIATKDNAPCPSVQKNGNALELNIQSSNDAPIEVVDSDDDDDCEENFGMKAVDNTVEIRKESHPTASPSTNNEDENSDNENCCTDSSGGNDGDDSESFGNRNQSSSSSNASEQIERNSLKRFKCKDCPFTAQYKSEFTRHQRIHEGVKPFKCEHCEYACREKGNLKQHQRVHDGEKLMGAVRNPEDGTYKCPHCDRQFIKWNGLSSHVTQIHKNNQRLFNCLKCMRPFTRINEKDRHEVRCQQRRYECYLCRKYFTKLVAKMQDHMRTHTGERPFTCAICNKSFALKRTLRIHLDSIHSRA